MTFVKGVDSIYRNEEGVQIKAVSSFHDYHLLFEHLDKCLRVHPESGWNNPTTGTSRFDPAAVTPGTHFVKLHLAGLLTPTPGLIPFADEEIARYFKEVLVLEAPTSKVTVTLNGVEV